ncbi:MAG: S28 family serine protease [Bacteroidales bacterium]|nr:S28 family serine protease [Bacteroidales bacterium]
MNKRILLLGSLLFSAFVAFAQNCDIEAMLKKIKSVSSFEKIEKADTTRQYFLMKFTQLLDPNNPEAGTFEQRVMLGHRGFERPTVVVTEGYGGDYAFSSPRYMEELTYIMDANILFVEYRYFSGSMPEPCNWEYLTVKNSMTDYHNIITSFKPYYTGKWASTGISKGGSTSIFFRAYFPEDLDVSVPYVGPLSGAVEDGRHESFLERVATKAERDAIRNFQIELFERKERLMPMFDEYCLKNNLVFRVPTSNIYDLLVLEYQFSMWQWGTPTNTIPALDSDDKTIFEYFVKMCGPDYFAAGSNIESFFVQAVKDFGYYGYNIEPFHKYVNEADIEGYLKRVLLPKEFADVKFDDSSYRFTTDFYTENDPKMLLIYGEVDPWTASGVTWLRDRNKQNIKVYIQPGGSHRARILNMPPAMRDEILEQLNEWMQYK